MGPSITKSLKAMPNLVFSSLPETYNLSAAERVFYNDKGYLVIAGLIDFGSLYSYKQRFQQIAKGLVSDHNVNVVKEPALRDKGAQGEDLINKLQDILYDDVFGSYFEHPRLLHVVSQLICGENGDGLKMGDNVTAMHSMFINKPPGTPEHPPHQDLHYFPFGPPSRIVASWTAVDDVGPHNGSLWVLPASHKDNVLHDHTNVQGANKLYHGISSPTHSHRDRIPLAMSPGDTVFFHPLLVHGSGANVSKLYRKSISGHFANSECSYLPPEGAQIQIAKEVEEIARKKGFVGTYLDFVKLRNKQVKGVRCNL